VQAREAKLDDILPCETLRKVEDLTLDNYQFLLEEPEWPASYGRLTRLTSLSFNFRHLPVDYHLPADFLATLGSLKSLQATANFDNFAISGEMHLLLLTRRLRNLTRLQIDVVDGKRRGEIGFALMIVDISSICLTVSQRLCTLGVLGWVHKAVEASLHRQASYFFSRQFAYGTPGFQAFVGASFG